MPSPSGSATLALLAPHPDTEPPAGRFALLLLWGAVFLTASTATRLALWLVLPDSAGVALIDLPGIFAVGLLYDLTFAMLTALPAAFLLWLVPQILWRRAGFRWFVSSVVVLSLYLLGFIVVAEWVFWDEFGTRFNFISVDYLIYRREVTENLWESYPLAWLLGSIGLLAGLAGFTLHAAVRTALSSVQQFRSRTCMFALITLMTAGAIALMDQKPRENFQNVYARELASSGPYQFFAAFRNNELDFDTFYASMPNPALAKELQALLQSPLATPMDTDPMGIYRAIDNPGTEQRLNIMLIMVESLSADYLTRFGRADHITPNLDALTPDSLFFSNFYATGTRTTRGLEAVTLSIPPTPGRSIVKRIGRESGMWSLGNVLKSKGYDTRFIYGGRGYFDNMNAFFAGNGYQVMDQSTIPDAKIGFSNAWGMADEYVFDAALAAADAAHAENRPFFFHIMTTSNHRPYTYPEARIPIPSGTGRNGAVMYTDYAIGRLLQAARAHDWFSRTLFVIVADHCAGSAGRESLPLERYHIPLWIYAPGLVAPGEYPGLASQVDIAPTLLGMLHMDYASSAFGKDLLQDDHPERALLGNYQNLGYLHNGLLTVLEPRKRIEVLDYGNAGAEPTEGVPDDALTTRTESYYQGAAWIYEHGLNGWARGQQLSHDRKPG